MNLTQLPPPSRIRIFMLSFVAIFAVCLCSVSNAADPLPSWNDGSSKTAILEFVAAVTDKINNDYVEPADRIAVFDNDGTLWVEYPIYTQVLFAFDRVKELAPQYPEWKTKQPFKALLEGDMNTVGAAGMKGLMEIVMMTHAGMTALEFDETASNWLATHQQFRFKRLYTWTLLNQQHKSIKHFESGGNDDRTTRIGP